MGLPKSGDLRSCGGENSRHLGRDGQGVKIWERGEEGVTKNPLDSFQPPSFPHNLIMMEDWGGIKIQLLKT